MSELSGFTRQGIARAVQRAIDEAGVRGQLPTPLHVIAQSAGIKEMIDISELPPAVAAKKPAFMRQVLGALWYNEEVAFIDRSLSSPRSHFTEAHEIGHQIIPWHRKSHELHFDDARRLDPGTDEELEMEANAAAVQLLFQGADFQNRAAGYERSLAVPLLLAEKYGTSRHATIRHYVEESPYELALVITGIHKYTDGSVPVWTTVQSPTFRAKYGPVQRWFSKGRLPLGAGEAIRPLGQLAARARAGEELPSMDIKKGLAGDRASFTAEAFYNQRSIFLLIRPRSRNFGRRVRLEVSASA